MPASIVFVGYAAISGAMLLMAARTTLAGRGESALFVNGFPLLLAAATAVLSLAHFLLPILWTRVGLAVCLAAIAAMNASLVIKHGQPLRSVDGILMTTVFTLVETGGFATPLVAGIAMWRPALLPARKPTGRQMA
ncbi:hypothetical protein [Kitasatospora sp. MBT66]|uniref:hypothetical protein n=1 Tax=Kitasatospora sp. MBT66 TaxID=1444769 RepID=UPI0005BDABF8|nr:hypothetical protein [Kitasatospora sp. MBT66]